MKGGWAGDLLTTSQAGWGCITGQDSTLGTHPAVPASSRRPLSGTSLSPAAGFRTAPVLRGHEGNAAAALGRG